MFSNFIFRIMYEDGYRSYSHHADIASFDVMKSFITENEAEPGISQKYFKQIKRKYLTRVDLKKLDIVGSLIHGSAVDFKDDPSGKIILAHTSLELTDQQKEIGSRLVLYQPKIQGVEYFFDHIRILYKRDYSHFRRTFRTQKWINFLYSLYQSCQILLECLDGQLRFQDAWYLIISIGFFPVSARHIAVVAIITGHLFALVGHMRTHGSQPLQRIERLGFLLVFGLVLHLPGFPMVGHPFPEERCANNIPGQIPPGCGLPIGGVHVG